MTNIEAKALALVNEVEREEGEKELTRRIMRGLIMDEALCRAIEAHEAFKQEVSDAAEMAVEAIVEWSDDIDEAEFLHQFIIPKPDPLVEIMEVLNGEWTPDEYAKIIRAALEARGLEIREKGQ